MVRVVAITGALLLAALLDGICLPAMWRSSIDFPQFYFAGQLVAAGEVSRIYDRAAYERLIEKAPIAREKVSLYYNRPAFGALLCLPLAWFSYTTSHHLFAGINLLLWGILIWKLPIWTGAPWHTRLWLACFFPFVGSAGICQDTLAITLVVAYACFVLADRNEVQAGILLSVCLVKPHLIVLLPLLFLLEKRRRMLRVFVASGAVLALVSFALVGPAGVRQWLDLLGAPTTDRMPEVMGNLRALALHIPPWAAVAAGLVAIAAGAAVILGGGYRERFVALVILTLLLSPHTYSQDYSLMAIVALISSNPFTRYGMLLPWYFFWPGNDMVLVVIVVLFGLAWAACKVLTKKLDPFPEDAVQPHIE